MRDYLPPELRLMRLREMQEAAAARGGRCLATTYEHCNARLPFECAVHGKFEAQPRHISAGGWCDGCRRDARKPSVKRRLTEYVQKRGGELLSDYLNARTHVRLKCPFHGEWRATPDNLLGKESWCPRCAKSQPRPGRRRKATIKIPLFV